jgi:V8-like Glu-specific endopeptidase
MNELMHKNIGAITFKHPHKNPQGFGTGFLISENLVLTCAHNLYDRAEKVYHLDLKFYPGVYGTLEKPFEVEAIRLPEDYLKEKSNLKSILFDYAILKLKQPVKHSQFLTLAVGFKDTAEALAIFGYP